MHMRKNYTPDAFDLSEDKGRAKAIKHLDTIIFDDDEYTIVPTHKSCSWDFEVILKDSKERIALIEVKDRDMKSTDRRLVNEGIHLDDHKYGEIRKEALKHEISAYFMATFTDGKSYTWDLLSCPTTTAWKMSNKTTAVKSEKVLKLFRLFQMNDNEIVVDLSKN